MDNKEININEIVCGNNYQVCFDEPYKDIERIVYGEILHFSTSGKVVMLDRNKSGVYIISHSMIKWMIPNGLSWQYKEKISAPSEGDADKTYIKIDGSASNV